jgi:hypothetical protein
MFTNGDVMSRCPDCSFGEGHYHQFVPSGGLLYSLKSNRVSEPEPFEDAETDSVPELTVEAILRPPIEEEPTPVLTDEDDQQEEENLDSSELSESENEFDAMQYAE